VKVVEAEFVAGDDIDDDTGADADGEAGYVDKRIRFVTGQGFPGWQ
jgi:hypothetical protein